MKRIAASVSLLVLAAVTVPLYAQQTPPEEVVPVYTETVDIRVINLDVVVTDKKGNPVSGLKADDFVVLENGREQKVTNFYEVTERHAAVEGTATGQAPAPEPVPKREERPEHLRRRIVIFVDNLSLAPFNRNRVFDSMKEFVRTALRPGDEAMIATWNRSMKVRVPFTGDRLQIEQALDAIKGESAYGLQHMSERRDVESRIRDARSYTDAVGYARGYAQSIEHDLRQTASAVNGLITTLAGVEGKKILVLASEGFPIQPGREMFYYIDEMKRQKREWGQAGSSLLEGMSFDGTTVIQSIARTANANGITLYALHAGGLMGYNEGSAEHAAPTPVAVEQAALSNSTDSLTLLASMTGGVATVGTNNFKSAFDRIERDLSSYYSIGYRSPTERVDRQRAVEVRTRNRKHVVRARKTFVEKSIPSEMTDRVVANLFYPSSSNDMKIFLTTGRPVQVEVDRFRVPVEVHIPMESLTLLPQGEILAGGFAVYVVAANSDGDMSDVNQQSHAIRMPAADMKSSAGKHYTWSVELLMEKGRNKISVGLIDEISRLTGFERQEVLAADLR